MASFKPRTARQAARRFYRIVNPAAVYTPELRTDISEIWLGGGEVLAIVTDDGDSTDDECGGVGSHEAKEAERVMKEEAAAARSIATATPEPAEERLPHTELSPTAAGAGGEETPAGEVVIDLTTVTAQKKLGKHLRKAPLGLGESGDAPALTVDVSGMVICPGFVDMHCHVTGGGGEAGYNSRTPEASFKEMIAAGITTFVGVLGTDSVSRTLEGLVAKTRGLAEDGLTGYMWTGAYAFPPPTLTKSVLSDIHLIPEVVGVGELAISDARGSQPTTQELARLASDTRVGGMLSGKPGLLYCHVGKEEPGLQPLFDVVEKTAVPITAIVPTHVSRTPELACQGMRWISKGGRLDLCSGSKKVLDTVALYRDRGVDLNSVSISSDCYGSKPQFDADGRLIKYGYQKPSVLLTIFNGLLKTGMAPAEALKLFTLNPATTLQIHNRKGRIVQGGDADLLVFEPQEDGTWKLKFVISRGDLHTAEPPAEK